MWHCIPENNLLGQPMTTVGHIQQQASLHLLLSPTTPVFLLFILCHRLAMHFLQLVISHSNLCQNISWSLGKEIILKSSPIPAVCGSADCADPCWGWVAAAICVTDCGCAWGAGCEDSCCCCEAAALPRDNMPPRPRPVPAGAWPGAYHSNWKRITGAKETMQFLE